MASRLSRSFLRARTPLCHGFRGSRRFGTLAVARPKAVALKSAILVGSGYLLYKSISPAQAAEEKKTVDLKAVKKDILKVLDNLDYDDGSYGPVLIRLAWHASGTYDKNKKTGGSNGAGMRFPPESDWGANAGLAIARGLLEPIKKKYPEISYSDLWIYAGYVALEAMGGPAIPFRGGRVDYPDGKTHPLPDGLLPDATKGAQHLRDIFGRMGFNDQEIVALSGAHGLGRCHPDRSGFVGPWTNAPTTFSNEFYRVLFEEKWVKEKAPNGAFQYWDAKTHKLMMLPTDLVLIEDPSFKVWAEKYAKDEKLFFQHFAAAFQKLTELGVPSCQKTWWQKVTGN
jgi:cytochrome c peroxidase